tara:strand:+ start:350 stop:508 length:159 start_codon:yes stop_codon:yes gene_type:complete
VITSINKNEVKTNEMKRNLLGMFERRILAKVIATKTLKYRGKFIKVSVLFMA